MFGLTFEKLFLVALVAAVVIGPARLPGYAHRLASLVRSLKAFVDTERTAAEAELGVPLTRAEWQALDVRQYDPRRIVRQALADQTAEPVPAAATPIAASWPEAVWAEAARVRPGQRYLVTGSAAHPRRVALASLPPDDPRRVAAAATSVSSPESVPSVASGASGASGSALT